MLSLSTITDPWADYGVPTLLLLLVVAIAVEIWLQSGRPVSRLRFGLHTLLIATTLVAVALGLIAWLR